MKNKLAVLSCIFSVLLSGMDESNVSYTFGRTIVQLTKGSMFDKDDGSLKHMVVGRKEQRQLQEPDLGDSSVVGELYTVDNNTVYIKNKDSDSASDDDTYKSFPVDISEKLWKKAHTKTLKTTAVAVVEPTMQLLAVVVEPTTQYNSFNPRIKGKQYSYYVERQDQKNKDSFLSKKFYGDDAIEAAKKDLAQCYDNVLTLGQVTPDVTNNSIGLPTLGTDVGFPREQAAPIAVATIIEFIKNNPNEYALIHLFVKKRSEYFLYKKLLEEQLAQ